MASARWKRRVRLRRSPTAGKRGPSSTLSSSMEAMETSGDAGMSMREAGASRVSLMSEDVARGERPEEQQRSPVILAASSTSSGRASSSANANANAIPSSSSQHPSTSSSSHPSPSSSSSSTTALPLPPSSSSHASGSGTLRRRSTSERLISSSPVPENSADDELPHRPQNISNNNISNSRHASYDVPPASPSPSSLDPPFLDPTLPPAYRSRWVRRRQVPPSSNSHPPSDEMLEEIDIDDVGFDVDGEGDGDVTPDSARFRRGFGRRSGRMDGESSGRADEKARAVDDEDLELDFDLEADVDGDNNDDAISRSEAPRAPRVRTRGRTALHVATDDKQALERMAAMASAPVHAPTSSPSAPAPVEDEEALADAILASTSTSTSSSEPQPMSLPPPSAPVPTPSFLFVDPDLSPSSLSSSTSSSLNSSLNRAYYSPLEEAIVGTEGELGPSAPPFFELEGVDGDEGGDEEAHVGLPSAPPLFEDEAEEFVDEEETRESTPSAPPLDGATSSVENEIEVRIGSAGHDRNPSLSSSTDRPP
ncbi:hypothetical protein SCHPADRAFT_909266 [Schizopora paradoxa]|uniref:Uncharacterized protein n=1 Tax=Schizopora paradoxa TaxID=27342 RepID=A0A0H2R778_9AGAM|nr:hypothetical protein SCHPADRAFT_909266 [Schizopora paradoxa]